MSMPAGELHCPEQVEKPCGRFLFSTDPLNETLSYMKSFSPASIPAQLVLGTATQSFPASYTIQFYLIVCPN